MYKHISIKVLKPDPPVIVQDWPECPLSTDQVGDGWDWFEKDQFGVGWWHNAIWLQSRIDKSEHFILALGDYSWPEWKPSIELKRV